MTEPTEASRPIMAVKRSISHARRTLALTHLNPDGDAIGSLVAFGHTVAATAADVRLYCESPIPSSLDWLHPPTPILNSLEDLGDWLPDRIVFLDCADDRRAGQPILDFVATCRATVELETVCIDHHAANPNYADVNWVDPTMSATGAMVALLAREMGLALAGDLGEAICLAIVSDTGSFTYGNTNALALELAAEVVRNGMSMADLTKKHENNWTLNRMHLWGALMKDVRLLCGGKVVVSVVTDELLARYSAPRTDLEGYASWLRRLANTKVVILARPSRLGSKISLRSMGDVDVQRIAAEFGGGGHKGAAGIDMAEGPDDAAAMVLKSTCRALGERESACD